jgi:hypothetical protein
MLISCRVGRCGPSAFNWKFRGGYVLTCGERMGPYCNVDGVLESQCESVLQYSLNSRYIDCSYWFNVFMNVSTDMKKTLIARNALNYNKDSEDVKLCIKPICPCSQFITYWFVWIWITVLNQQLCSILLLFYFLTGEIFNWHVWEMKKTWHECLLISNKSYRWGEASVRQWQDNHRDF